MNLKPVTALIALVALSLAGCGNKGPLVQAAPPPVESVPAGVETTAPAEVPAETPPMESAPTETLPADAPPVEVPPAEAPPATEVPATDAQGG